MSTRSRSRARLLLLLGFGTGCFGSSEAPREVVRQSPSPAPLPSRAAATPRAATVLETRGDLAIIPAGTVRAGSAPGTFGRDARTEARSIALAVSGFAIERAPSSTSATTQAEAEAQCANRGRRLCTELEWERACEGDDDRAYITGAQLDVEGCAMNESTCASGPLHAFGALSAEWTASRVADSAVVRGADVLAPVARHRCAARSFVRTTAEPRARAVRCCEGVASAVTYPAIERVDPFTVIAADDPVATAVLGVPEIRALGSVRLGRYNDAIRSLGNGNRTTGGFPGWTFHGGLARWSPIDGEELWIVSGVSARGPFIAALYRLDASTWRHAASFVLDGEDLPIGYGFFPEKRDEILFSTCWGCGGEGGAFVLRDDGTVDLEQR